VLLLHVRTQARRDLPIELVLLLYVATTLPLALAFTFMTSAPRYMRRPALHRIRFPIAIVLVLLVAFRIVFASSLLVVFLFVTALIDRTATAIHIAIATRSRVLVRTLI
jgi:hypothetical protein